MSAPRYPPYPIFSPQSQPIPPNKTRCAIGDHLVEYTEYVCLSKRVSPGMPTPPGTPPITQIVYEGCTECLDQRLAVAAAGDLSLATRGLLKRALVAITQPVGEREIDAVAQAIQDALKG